MTNDESSSNGRSSKQEGFDLEERTARFGEAAIRFRRKAPVDPITSPLITQLVKAGTSVGANYDEANDAESKKAFMHHICVCRKESKESKHFLRMMAAALPELREEAAVLWQEAKELNLIFGSIWRGKRAKNRVLNIRPSNIRS
jgi:four helix bundle protein